MFRWAFPGFCGTIRYYSWSQGAIIWLLHVQKQMIDHIEKSFGNFEREARTKASIADDLHDDYDQTFGGAALTPHMAALSE